MYSTFLYVFWVFLTICVTSAEYDILYVAILIVNIRFERTLRTGVLELSILSFELPFAGRFCINRSYYKTSNHLHLNSEPKIPGVTVLWID